MYVGFEVCQIQWYRLWVSMISGCEKSKISETSGIKWGYKPSLLCCSPPCIPFYPYTMFQNPMPKPSCQKFRKTFITEKLLVTQSSDIVYCDLNTEKPVCADFQAFWNTFSLFKLMFLFICVRRSSVNRHKFHILLILTDIVHCDRHTRNLSVQIFKPFEILFPCSNWCFFHFVFGGVQETGINFTFCWFWQGKMHWNGLSGMYVGFEVCQIQWHRFWVSMISGSWRIKKSGKNFTFCCFWLGKMHWNGLSGMYVGFEVCQIQWHRFWVSMISGSWKIKNLRKNFTFC